MIKFSLEEEKMKDEIREVYNSGNCDQAVEMSKAFLTKFPESFLARYSYATMSGDFAYDPRHSKDEKQILLEIAKKGIAELFNDPNLSKCPASFQSNVKNEYYWFHELPELQYQLGINELETNAKGGHYSACVGASMLAFKHAHSRDFETSKNWAEKSICHFFEFEKLAPNWYNINYFCAQAFACLGQYDEALRIFKDMFRKQGNDVNQTELELFKKMIESLRKSKSY